MKIIFDIGHPAHVHYFKYSIKHFLNQGYEVTVLARNRYPVQELLRSANIEFIDRGYGRNSKLGKFLYMLFIDLRILLICLRKRPDLYVSFGAIYLTHVAWLMRKPSIFLDDTDNNLLNRKFYIPFASHILTPDVYRHDLGSKHLRFKGYMELAYLHPRVNTRDESILHDLGLVEGEIFSVVRFVNWNASHDYGHYGISNENKVRIVKKLEEYGKVFITSEKNLPKEIAHNALKISPNRIHSLMSYSSLLFGESATMASESAVLGVPAIYIDNDGRCYTDELEHAFGMVYNYDETEQGQAEALSKACEILEKHDVSKYAIKSKEILKSKISFSDFLIWLIEKYPKSISKLSSDTDYQDQFIFPYED